MKSWDDIILTQNTFAPPLQCVGEISAEFLLLEVF
jgi:hypothetical protein